MPRPDPPGDGRAAACTSSAPKLTGRVGAAAAKASRSVGANSSAAVVGAARTSRPTSATSPVRPGASRSKAVIATMSPDAAAIGAAAARRARRSTARSRGPASAVPSAWPCSVRRSSNQSPGGIVAAPPCARPAGRRSTARGAARAATARRCAPSTTALERTASAAAGSAQRAAARWATTPRARVGEHPDPRRFVADDAAHVSGPRAPVAAPPSPGRRGRPPRRRAGGRAGAGRRPHRPTGPGRAQLEGEVVGERADPCVGAGPAQHLVDRGGGEVGGVAAQLVRPPPVVGGLRFGRHRSLRSVPRPWCDAGHGAAPSMGVGSWRNGKVRTSRQPG